MCEGIASRGGAEVFHVAERALGADHTITIELNWRWAQAKYRHHFFGHENFRKELIQSICILFHVGDNSSRVLGDHHPLTENIHASIELCFAEQLDWTLDDFSPDLREVAQEHL